MGLPVSDDSDPQKKGKTGGYCLVFLSSLIALCWFIVLGFGGLCMIMGDFPGCAYLINKSSKTLTLWEPENNKLKFSGYLDRGCSTWTGIEGRYLVIKYKDKVVSIVDRGEKKSAIRDEKITVVIPDESQWGDVENERK
ncbi:MAG: hypothetical protein LWY06_00745 [Firmicutes bacterium]|nr:hypothetical protein [Bacillota bacterium]